MPTPYVDGQPADTAIPPLVRFGLDPDADLVYRTLATFGSATARALSRDLGMPVRRVDDALEALSDVGAAYRLPQVGRSRPCWCPAPPEAVLRELTARRRLAARQRIAPAVLPYVVHELGPQLQHLPSREAVRARMARLVGLVRREHLAIHTEMSFEPSVASAAAAMDKTLFERKVGVRVLGVQPSDVAALISPGEHNSAFSYREAPSVPLKMFILDRRVALFPVDQSNHDKGYLETTQEPVVRALVALFEQHWQAAWDPMEAYMPAISLTPREQALIALLVAGHTDLTAAQELQISERTVSTIMRSLMDRVGVENRFQLGVALGALRAAPPPPGLIKPPAPAAPQD
jgi:DNA-binding CsgD family transcriptional regulator/sugar-specific transcriptional regulator TrmB